MARPVNIIAKGSAQIDTADSKFGTGALLLPGNSNSGLEVNDSGLIFDSNDTFTIEFFFKPDTANGFRYLWSQGWYDAGNAQFTVSFDGGRNIIFQTTSNGQDNSAYANAGPVSLNAWHHVAVTFSGGHLQIFVDGTRKVNQNSVIIYNDPTPTNPRIGANAFDTEDLDGHIDELRVSNIVRYSGTSLQVPTSAFENDFNTLLLLHMDGANGSTTFTDDNTTPVPVPTNLSVTNITATGARLNWSPGQ